mmetsp:Transcript_81147/g.225817  ORF Transcript_81147/g.225817 Transcript_81147/m.225817 type:complete len:800 (-) Transcript_81147:62-2461(-)
MAPIAGVLAPADDAAANADAQARKPASVFLSCPDYTPPPWAGTPSPEGEFAVELIVRGEVRTRVSLDLKAHNCFCIGRAKSCDVVLEGIEPRASRFHCILQCKEGSPELYVFDLKSSHGTLVNGRRIDPMKFEPVRVGEQLRFNADKPTPTDCIAVLCGPEGAMVDEVDVDLTRFREQAAKERAEKERAEQSELARRKEAKRRRLHDEAQRKAVTTVLAERAQKKMQMVRESEEKDRERLHRVTWGMADDAMELPDAAQDENVQRLMGPDGRLDGEKVRQRNLTEKQEQLLTKLEQKQKKLTNLEREKARIESRAVSAKSGGDMDTEFDVVERDRGGGVNLEQAARLEEKIEKVEDELGQQTDNLLLSLGLKKVGDAASKPNKKRTALYETKNEDSDDDFFDRTKPQNKSAIGPMAQNPDEASELAGLPSLHGVQNKASLESTVGLLGAERARVTAQIAMETAKERQRTAAAAAGLCSDEDSLDAFMSGTLEEIRQDRRQKLRHRLAVVESRTAEAQRMLAVARRNAEEPPTGPASSSSAAVPTSAAASQAPMGAEADAAADDDAKIGVGGGDGAPNTAAGAASSDHDRMRGPREGLADALARLKAQGAMDEPVAEVGGDGDDTNASALASEVPKQGASATGQRTKRGPERPPADLLRAASAGVAEVVGESLLPLKSKENVMATTANLVVPQAAAKAPAASAAADAVTAAAVAAAAMAAASRQRVPNAQHVDVGRGGLQLMAPGAGSKRAAPEEDAAMLPPPAPKKKVYGAPRRPEGRMASAARDADMEASGELVEPEG